MVVAVDSPAIASALDANRRVTVQGVNEQITETQRITDVNQQRLVNQTEAESNITLRAIQPTVPLAFANVDPRLVTPGEPENIRANLLADNIIATTNIGRARDAQISADIEGQNTSTNLAGLTPSQVLERDLRISDSNRLGQIDGRQQVDSVFASQARELDLETSDGELFTPANPGVDTRILPLSELFGEQVASAENDTREFSLEQFSVDVQADRIAQNFPNQTLEAPGGVDSRAESLRLARTQPAVLTGAELANANRGVSARNEDGAVAPVSAVSLGQAALENRQERELVRSQVNVVRESDEALGEAFPLGRQVDPEIALRAQDAIEFALNLSDDSRQNGVDFDSSALRGADLIAAQQEVFEGVNISA